MTREEAMEQIKHIISVSKKNERNEKEIDGFDETALEVAIEALKQEPCGDCISRVDAMRAITDEWVRTYGKHTLEGFTDAIYNLPAVMPEQPVMTGEWITKRTQAESEGRGMKYKYIVGYCSDCGKVTKWRKECPKGTWHCMNCNGKAESEGENENHD